MIEPFVSYLVLIIVILALMMLAQKLKIAYPIVLVIGGLLLSMIPGLPVISINPELIFIIFLPPLLYEAAWYTSWKEFWKWRRVISSFAFLIVLITSFLVAVVSSQFIPGFTLALGFLLGGILSPPDAVSASSILKNISVPRRVTNIIEGESLLNDASSLIVFRFALIAVDSGRFIFHEAATSFVLVIVMGILTGVFIGFIYFKIHKLLPTGTDVDIILTLTAPYVMYIAAEEFHFSGVLSVVSGSLFLSARKHIFLTHSSRLRGSNVWSSLGFVLNGLVFMLIGLELPVIIGQLGDVSLLSAIGYGLLISAVLIVSRIICCLGASVFTVFISRFIKTADSRPGWRGPMILAWAGMRGVVSLAAALSVPLLLTNGQVFPQRNLIVFITFIVILVTLVLQGLTLPLLIKWVNMQDPDVILTTEEQHLLIKKKLAVQGLKLIDSEHSELVKSNKLLQQLKSRFEQDQVYVDSYSKTEKQKYLVAYRQLLMKQRLYLHDLDKKEEIDYQVIAKFQHLLDLEEEKVVQ